MAACAADKALRPEVATPQHLKPFINAAFPTLLTASPAALLAHLECLKAFNAMAATAMPLVDLGLGSVPGTLASALVRGAALLWPKVSVGPAAAGWPPCHLQLCGLSHVCFLWSSTRTPQRAACSLLF